jgi:spermidine/putrescine transport system permease protein
VSAGLAELAPAPLPSQSARRRRRRRRGFDRPRTLVFVTALVLAFMLVPILVVLLFSFNGERSLATFSGFSLHWYREAFQNGELRASLWVSIEIALIATLVSTVLGTILAFGLERGNRRAAGATNAAVMLRLVSPETATAVAALLLFTQLGITLSNTTIILSHIAFCMAFVTVVVRSRLASLNPEVEAAAMDLGATRLHALRLVALPLLWPAILSAAMLSFVLSFDDFVTSLFTSGIGTPPLPVRIYAMLKFGVTPVVNALGVLMVLVIAAVAVLAVATMRLASRRAPLTTLAEEPADA